jgi:hypothetical protein
VSCCVARWPRCQPTAAAAGHPTGPVGRVGWLAGSHSTHWPAAAAESKSKTDQRALRPPTIQPANQPTKVPLAPNTPSARSCPPTSAAAANRTSVDGRLVGGRSARCPARARALRGGAFWQRALRPPTNQHQHTGLVPAHPRSCRPTPAVVGKRGGPASMVG